MEESQKNGNEKNTNTEIFKEQICEKILWTDPKNSNRLSKPWEIATTLLLSRKSL